jgi:hypothetical protein
VIPLATGQVNLEDIAPLFGQAVFLQEQGLRVFVWVI